MSRPTIVALAAVAALFSSVLMSGPAYAAPSSPPVVQGVLYDLDGTPATAGQLVTLVAWPSSDVLAALKPGDAVPTTVVDTTATSASGAFSLGFSSPDAARRLADPNGDINLSVQSMAGGVAHTYNVIGHTDPGGFASTTDAAGRPVGPTTIQLRPIPGAVEPDATADQAIGAKPDNGVPCGWLELSNLGPRWVQVGEAYTTLSTTAAFTYKTGSSSTIGAGVSTSGAKGTFSASGSSSVSSTVTIGMTPVSGIAGRLWRTEFVFSKFGYKCGALPYSQYMVKATSFAGGGIWSATSGAPTATHCTTYVAGQSFTKDTASAQTFSAGAALAGDIGINLSAQTGFSTNTSLKFTFAATKQLCGTNAYPPAAARLVAK